MEVNHGLGLVVRLVMMGACLSSNVARVVL